MAYGGGSVALVALLVAGCAALASATTYVVGDSQGWTTAVDYTTWASGKSFAVGDVLMFKYTSKAHTVTEVGASGYSSCSGANAISDDDSGSTTVTLIVPGTHYFICNVPGHCAAGMKLAVTVSATPTASTTQTGGAAAGGSLAPAVGSALAAAALKLALL